ncbi:MAG: sugar porter family MFS transporter [Bryobacteraceae bacterium]
MNSIVFRGTWVAALGGLLFGFDTAVIAGVTRSLSDIFSLSPAGLGFTVSIALWGTVLGAMTAGYIGDRLGRRESLHVMAILYFLCAAGCAMAWNWHSLLFFRLLGGVAIGGSSVLGPMYIAEIAPAKWRGRLVGFFQLNVVVGVLLAYLSNYLVGLAGTGGAEWRWKLVVSAAPAALFFFSLFKIPQSPRWLVSRNRLEEARRSLEGLGEPDPDHAVQEIIRSLTREGALRAEKLFSRKYRFPVFLAIATGMFNQFTGINAIIYYLNDIFQRAGFTKVSSDVQAVVIGFTNLVFTVIAMSVIDRIGRKLLLLVGSVGLFVCLGGVAYVFETGEHMNLLLYLLVGYIAFFAFSQGAVIWVYLSEVFPNLVRAKGQSLGSVTHWLMNALISGLFPFIAAKSAFAPFVFFALMMVMQFFVVLFVFPETKGVPLEDVETVAAIG